MFYPYAKPEVLKEDINAVVNVLKNGYLTQGDQLEIFQKNITDKFDCNYSVICNSGTAALHLVYSNLGLDSDNGLLTSPITFLATANAARMCNAPVVFSDVDPLSGLLTPENVEKAILKSEVNIKVITVVHLGGKICDLKGIAEVAEKYNCYLVEDACHAPGAFFNEGDTKRYIGDCSYSIASTFSFHAIKHVTMGEGGCITTNNKKLFKSIIAKRNHGMLRNDDDLKYKPEKIAPWYYEMHDLGWNYRADELSCALGISQLKRLNKNIIKRQKLVKLYNNFLKSNEYITLPELSTNKYYNVWHLYSLLIDFDKAGITRGKLMSSLQKDGIGTQVHYIPLYLQPYYRSNKPVKFKGAESYYSKTLSIPLYVQLTRKDIDFISSKINSYIS